MALYLGSTPRLQSFFSKDWMRPDLTLAEGAAIWLKILSTIFCFPNNHPFQIKPQIARSSAPFHYKHLTTHDTPVWVLFDDETTIAVVEVRSPKQRANWSSIHGLAYTYIDSLPKSKYPHVPTIGIIAQGDKFICWEQTREGCTLPRTLFPSRSEPASVVADSGRVEKWFEEVRERAISGEFV